MTQRSPFPGGKITGLLLLLLLSLIPTMEGKAASFLYEFKGTIQGSSSYNPDYPESALNAVLGVPEISYLFEIDFDRDVRADENNAAVWHLFYARLLGDGVMETLLESEASLVTLGFNAKLGDLRPTYVPAINLLEDDR